MEHHEIQGFSVTFEENDHQYTVDGYPVVSVTQLIDAVLGKPYKRVDPLILEKAAEKGTLLHDRIAQYEMHQEKAFHPEMQTYLALKRQHHIEVVDSEKIVVIQHDGVPIAAGRFDMVVRSPIMKGLGIVDVKRSLHLHEDRLKLQLNLYKLGYEQTYKEPIHYLKCMRIRHRFNEYVDVSVDKAWTLEKIEKYLVKHPIDYTRYMT